MGKTKHPETDQEVIWEKEGRRLRKLIREHKIYYDKTCTLIVAFDGEIVQLLREDLLPVRGSILEDELNLL
jgi:hypothetical protein